MNTHPCQQNVYFGMSRRVLIQAAHDRESRFFCGDHDNGFFADIAGVA